MINTIVLMITILIIMILITMILLIMLIFLLLLLLLLSLPFYCTPTPADIPARKHYLGSDMSIRWQWSAEDKPSHVYLHLMCHRTDRYLLSLHFGRSIANTGFFSWPVDAAFAGRSDEERQLQSHFRVVYFAMTLQKYSGAASVPVGCRALSAAVGCWLAVGCLVVWMFGCLVVWLFVCWFDCLFACSLVCGFCLLLSGYLPEQRLLHC